MFTGIIKEVGKVEKLVQKDSLTQIAIQSLEVNKESEVSDSISVNGVCLTLVYKEKNLIFFEAIRPTFQKTNLKRLKNRDWVNLEPALKIGEKLGGHFVLGHVDGEVKVKRIINKSDYYLFELEAPCEFRKYVVENGSISVEGISLTIKNVLPRIFRVDIIPFTYNNTNLKHKRPGDWVNIEFDYLLKSSLK